MDRISQAYIDRLELEAEELIWGMVLSEDRQYLFDDGLLDLIRRTQLLVFLAGTEQHNSFIVIPGLLAMDIDMSNFSTIDQYGTIIFDGETFFFSGAHPLQGFGFSDEALRSMLQDRFNDEISDDWFIEWLGDVGMLAVGSLPVWDYALKYTKAAELALKGIEGVIKEIVGLQRDDGDISPLEASYVN